MNWFNVGYEFLVALHPVILGATSALSLTAALIFLRFYRKTGDRLFLFFSAAFAIMGLNRLAFVVVGILKPSAETVVEPEPIALYVIRLLAFGLILFAIIDKNRSRRRPG